MNNPICSISWKNCKFCRPLSSECSFDSECEYQIEDNIEDYYKELVEGLYD